MGIKKGISRREFTRVTLAATAGVGLLGSGIVWVARSIVRSRGTDITDADLPVEKVGKGPPEGFGGDRYERPHNLFWNKKSKPDLDPEKMPPADETVGLVVVGGGMSGLLTAWQLRDYKPVLLEQAKRLGGNSRGEQWDDLKYSIGAAYIATPEPNSPHHRLLEQLGLLGRLRREKTGTDSAVLLNGSLIPGFWNGATDPENAADYRRVFRELYRIRREQYPEIPHRPDSSLSSSQFFEWDNMSFREFCDHKFGRLPSQLEQYLREYCWSSFGGDDNEVSAAQVLNYLTSDIDGVCAFPGGNSYITQILVERLVRSLPRGNLRTSSIGVDVRLTDDGVEVTYEDSKGTYRRIKAKACVMACPKFLGQYLIHDYQRIAPENALASKRLKYRAYLVANVLLKKPIKSQGYEVFRLGGAGTETAMREAISRVPYTDLVFGAWAQNDQAKHSVLTLYKAFAYETGRQDLFAPNALEREKKNFEDAMPELLNALKIPPSEVETIRLTRWGHAIPLAAPGLASDGTCVAAAKPIQNRIFFAQQDNWANPAFETCVTASFDVAGQVRKALG